MMYLITIETEGEDSTIHFTAGHTLFVGIVGSDGELTPMYEKGACQIDGKNYVVYYDQFSNNPKLVNEEILNPNDPILEYYRNREFFDDAFWGSSKSYKWSMPDSLYLESQIISNHAFDKDGNLTNPDGKRFKSF